MILQKLPSLLLITEIVIETICVEGGDFNLVIVDFLDAIEERFQQSKNHVQF
jgi:hypothetical protein